MEKLLCKGILRGHYSQYGCGIHSLTGHVTDFMPPFFVVVFHFCLNLLSENTSFVKALKICLSFEMQSHTDMHTY